MNGSHFLVKYLNFNNKFNNQSKLCNFKSFQGMAKMFSNKKSIFLCFSLAKNTVLKNQGKNWNYLVEKNCNEDF